MRVKSLTLAAAGLALLAPVTPSAAARPSPAAAGAPGARQEGSVSAADLLARVRDCTPVSRGRYRTDEGAPATVPVCGTDEAVFWTADMDIDCDGRPGTRCNSRTDPLFSEATAYTQSDGRYLSAETLPYIVVPGVSALWDHHAHGVYGGSVAAVVYRDRVQYAVVGDVGPREIIGEASYATAEALGIRPDPHGGGTPSGVTYIVFRNSRATPIESHASAVAVGERLARQFARGTEPSAQPMPMPMPTPVTPPSKQTQTGSAESDGALLDEPDAPQAAEIRQDMNAEAGTETGHAQEPEAAPGAPDADWREDTGQDEDG